MNKRIIIRFILALVCIIVLSIGILFFYNIRNNKNNSTSKANETEVDRTDNKKNIGLNSSYDNPYLPNGFEHIKGTWNDGYVIKEKDTENEFVWVPCVLDQSKVKSGDTVVSFAKITTGSQYNGHYELLPEYSIPQKEDDSVQEIEESVNKYGGFYIARYETGVEDTKPVSKAERRVYNNVSKTGALKLSKNMIDTEKTGVKSTLISGAAWDTTIQWMVNASDNKEQNKGYDMDATGKGWYKDISNETIHTTGYYAVNNIYDMAGNVCEYTSEIGRFFSNKTILDIRRGGDYESDGKYSAASRSNSLGGPFKYTGFRVVLYL